jgi:zinc transport system substrate-binding protein
MKRKIVFILLVLAACSVNEKGKETIFVTILPQKYFIERIAQNDFEIKVMIPPGQSPATYEPLPQQLLELDNAEAYFTIGVPFETVWIDRIKSNNSGLPIFSTREGITLRKTESFTELDGIAGHTRESDHVHHEFDPHIWLSPSLVKIQAENIYNGLVKINPSNKDRYAKNLRLFRSELNDLRNRIDSILAPAASREILVYHPAWGYFADEFNLKQVPIEIGGKEPGIKQLAAVIKLAKERGVKALYVQRQFAAQSAKAVADEIDLKIIYLDPLAENYPENLISIANLIRENQL